MTCYSGGPTLRKPNSALGARSFLKVGHSPYVVFQRDWLKAEGLLALTQGKDNRPGSFWLIVIRWGRCRNQQVVGGRNPSLPSRVPSPPSAPDPPPAGPSVGQYIISLSLSLPSAPPRSPPPLAILQRLPNLGPSFLKVGFLKPGPPL